MHMRSSGQHLVKRYALACLYFTMLIMAQRCVDAGPPALCSSKIVFWVLYSALDAGLRGSFGMMWPSPYGLSSHL